MNDAITKALREVKEADERSTKALEKLAALEGAPVVIDASDQAAINANFQRIFEGTAVVMRIDKPRRKLRANEIATDDVARQTQFFEQIRSGLMVIVDPSALPYEDEAG